MTERTNPLAENLKKGGNGKVVTVEKLHELVERSNKKQWVIDSGQPYFVNRRWEDGANGEAGKYVHFLDRRQPETDPGKKVILAEFGLGSRYPSNRA